MVKVFGHISPDTDTTCCAILWTWYLNTHTTQKATAHVLGTLNKETAFVLKHWDVAEPAFLESITAGEDVIIVDTNNPQELFSLDMIIRPLASTATVIYDLIHQHEDTIPKAMAGLLLSCILSDTLAFRSPTTTPHDKDVAEKMAKKLGVDITSYANEMFAAKSDVSDFTAHGLINIDSKKTALGDKNLRISVVETTDPASILKRKDEIVTAIHALLKEEKDIDDVLFFVIDIFKEESTVFTYNTFTKSLISTSFGVHAHGDTEVLPGVVSRKKQIIPALQLPKQ